MARSQETASQMAPPPHPTTRRPSTSSATPSARSPRLSADTSRRNSRRGRRSASTATSRRSRTRLCPRGRTWRPTAPKSRSTSSARPPPAKSFT
ncbi:hypothetical protein VTK26DRAFT_4003 [Humicola hyalothermophila]